MIVSDVFDRRGPLQMFELLKRLGQDSEGATAVEYGLILSLIFLSMVGAVQAFGNQVVNTWTRVDTTISNATGN